MKFDRLVEKARLIAPKIDERARSKHISFLLDKNKIVSYGYNQGWKSHSLGKLTCTRYAAIHSEAHSIIKCNRRIDKLHQLTMVNIRFRRDGSLALSRPCVFCQKLLDLFRIRDVYFTNQDGDFEKWYPV